MLVILKDMIEETQNCLSSTLMKQDPPVWNREIDSSILDLDLPAYHLAVALVLFEHRQLYCAIVKEHDRADAKRLH